MVRILNWIWNPDTRLVEIQRMASILSKWFDFRTKMSGFWMVPFQMVGTVARDCPTFWKLDRLKSEIKESGFWIFPDFGWSDFRSPAVPIPIELIVLSHCKQAQNNSDLVSRSCVRLCHREASREWPIRFRYPRDNQRLYQQVRCWYQEGPLRQHCRLCWHQRCRYRRPLAERDHLSCPINHGDQSLFNKQGLGLERSFHPCFTSHFPTEVEVRAWIGQDEPVDLQARVPRNRPIRRP